MNGNGKIAPGTKVQIKGYERPGVVIPDVLGLCSSGSVMVEVDAASSVTSFKCSDLEVVEILTIEVTSEKCQGCIFNRGKACMRYGHLRLGALVSAPKKIIPQRIYPFCKEEISVATG